MAEPTEAQDLLNEQIAYYKARAPEYDQWWLRQGRYDLGEDFNRQWLKEIEEVRAALDDFSPRGDVLEVAAGTGIWTAELARYAERITAIDTSSEALQICRQRLEGMPIQASLIEADVFEWRPDKRYDVVFFSFWLSHVPATHFSRFWRLVEEAVVPGGHFFLMDTAPPKEEIAIRFPRVDVDARARDPDVAADVTVRHLTDGRSFQIVKRHWSPSNLEKRLSQLGWDATIRKTRHFFIYGSGMRRQHSL